MYKGGGVHISGVLNIFILNTKRQKGILNDNFLISNESALRGSTICSKTNPVSQDTDLDSALLISLWPWN